MRYCLRDAKLCLPLPTSVPCTLHRPREQVNLEAGGELTCSLSYVILDQLKQ